MSEMVERVARAIVMSQCQRSGMGATANCALDPGELEDARAAIEAMREPTEAMIESGNYNNDPTDTGLAKGMYIEMIGTALKP